MLDQNILNSVLSTGGAGRAESKSKSETGDAEAFDAALNDASKSKDKKKSEESKSESRSESKDSAKKREAKEHDEQQQKAAASPQDRTSAIHMQKLMKKSVDTLSLAEKQALRVAEFAGENEQPVKALPQPQALLTQAAPQQAAKAGKSGKNPIELGLGREASAKVRDQAERADEKTLQAVEELQKQDQPKASSGNLDQLLAKEAGFAEEVSKTSATERNRERQGVIDQILQQIEVRNFNSRTELNLKLNPEYLGELKVKLIHTDDGVRADFETSSKKTRELLREGVEELKTQAKSKGIRLRSARFTLVENVDTEAVG